MMNLLRSLLPQSFINNFYHYPKAFLASLFYGFPTRKLTVIGVTGTDGKTTTTNMIYQILKGAGKKVSMVSTINAVVGSKSYDTGFHVTSPDPFMIQKFARTAVKAGDKYIVLEVTSHGLDQYRFLGIKFDVGVITNITHEHLDYHKTFENYLNTKLKLLKNVRQSVVNENLKEKVSGKVITFGLIKGDVNQKEAKLKLKIPGDYNIENALASMATAFVLDIDKKIARNVLENFEGLSGRMQEVKNSKGIKIVIDFAHTPNGLEQALKALKSQTKGRLISLIGCEGFRDEEKRKMMGEIAQRLSSIVVVTSVDPRGQWKIIKQKITEGALKAGAREGINFFVEENREKAIYFAINKLSKKGDTIGIFGKGHEKSMNIDGKEIPWSDFEEVQKALL
ncbi:hypothetical protein A3C59_04830 [Candidatus Daviesbacteria bacterium RIFCSPHIGHO2_02_FULL_36_13]|uniref:UDP-N-acetylmuramoyl-L-alanyl-D-glutamate--2, 6-diaminopimelate ligase n=1 Tax=Candidatus Daviesbacteria bacterium RIFCSPHIGHO2_02_FULL_36_13 TaxID=1797768 RepID=A0A1F5JNU6_9BACT|nr:MAG: hypothetical protein A3C59_04830 [Candidatus Daviesbacteria bacterium RIFCSPHIGHO2_02_FULL_36_13]